MQKTEHYDAFVTIFTEIRKIQKKNDEINSLIENYKKEIEPLSGEGGINNLKIEKLENTMKFLGLSTQQRSDLGYFIEKEE